MLLMMCQLGQDHDNRLETLLLEERTKEAALQLHVAALCAELTRAADVTGAPFFRLERESPLCL